MAGTLATGSALRFFDYCVDDVHPGAKRPDRPTDPDQQPIPDRPRRLGKWVTAALCLTGLAAGLVTAIGPASARPNPSAQDWYRLRVCESSDNYRIDTGNGYYGAYQFDVPTWRSVGGTGLPSRASKAEQDALALKLYQERGWQPWTCATILGLGDDPNHAIGSKSGPHGWRGTTFHEGNHSRSLVRWQKQMHVRGATILQGTGQFGPKTESVVRTLQRQNRIPVNGQIGRRTWELAWSGHFVPTASTSLHRPEAPPWAGHTLSIGDWNNQVARFQKQLRARGATRLLGTGEFGPITESIVKTLQRQNGLDPVGFVGPETWRLAWTGSYHR